jgi:hypothetical protein
MHARRDGSCATTPDGSVRGLVRDVVAQWLVVRWRHDRVSERPAVGRRGLLGLLGVGITRRGRRLTGFQGMHALLDLRVLSVTVAARLIRGRRGSETDAAVGRDGIQVCSQSGGGEAVEKPVEQAQVHAAHELGVLLRQCVERAVGQRDVPILDTRLEAVCLKYPQHSIPGVPGIMVAGFAARGFTEFFA